MTDPCPRCVAKAQEFTKAEMPLVALKYVELASDGHDVSAHKAAGSDG